MRKGPTGDEMTVEKDPVGTIAGTGLDPGSAGTEMIVPQAGTGNPGAGQGRQKNGLEEIGQRVGLVRRGLAGIGVIGTGMIAAVDAFYAVLGVNRLVEKANPVYGETTISASSRLTKTFWGRHRFCGHAQVPAFMTFRAYWPDGINE